MSPSSLQAFTGRCCLLLIACWLLASCTTTPATGSIEQPDWEISGKIGVKEGTLRATTTLFHWQQQEDRYVIFLLNPLGQTELILSGDRRHARAESADGATTTADSPEALLQLLTGWYFPVNLARHWLQGETTGIEQAITTTPAGQPGAFTSGPWHVTLEQYQPVTGHLLPHRITLRQPDLDITLLIKKHAHFNP